MKIISPIPSGCGAYVLHKSLEAGIEGYRVWDYSPYWEYFPFALPLLRGGEKPDLVHTTPDHGLFFHRKGIPLVITAHHIVLDDFMQAYSTPLQRLHYKTDLRCFTLASLKRASVVTSISMSTAKMLRDELGYDKDIRIIYNGIDTNRFLPPSVPPQKTGEIRVLFAGNLTRRKGANLLPAIASRLQPDVRIYYTRGLRKTSPLPALPNLIDRGYIPAEDMPALYRNADILLFPTVREGFGLAAAEAMACGLPVVATDCSSLPELIDDGKGGFLCPLGDVGAFAEKINFLAENPELRREMGDYNRAKVEKMFTMDRMVMQYRELFEEVVAKQ